MNENNAPQLKVSPLSVDFDLKNGDTLEDVLTISNTSNASMSYSVYADSYYVDENYNPVFTIKNEYTKLAEWISFQNDSGDFIDKYTSELASGESKELRYRIAMPENAEEFSQYAMFFIESEDSNTENIGGVLINSRIGILVSGKTDVLKLVGEGKNLAGEVGAVDFERFLLSGNVEVGTSVVNSGTVAFDAVERVTVRNVFGAELYNVENIVEVMPETTRNMAVEWEATPIFGILNVEYSVSAGGDVVAGSQTVVKMPATIIITAIFVVLVAIVSAIKILRNRKRMTGKYFGFRNNREDRRRRRSRRLKIHWPKFRLPKIRRSRGRKKDSD